MHLNEKRYSTAKHVRISERDQEILVRLHFAGNQLDFSVHVVPLIDIKSLHLDELRGIAQPPYRADQIADWLYQKRVTSFAEMTNLPQALRTKLADNLCFGKIEIIRVLGSKDTTRKFLFRLSDNNLIESVLIPASPALYGSPSDRRTICVSTQVGCAYGCKFCASGLDGWKRNLRANEIVNQILAVERWNAKQRQNPKPATRTQPDAASGPVHPARATPPAARFIDNLVIMGMGEPLANYENLLKAL